MIFNFNSMSQCEEWVVVFCKTDKDHWLLNWMHPHSHCYAYAKVPDSNAYIVINSAWSDIAVTHLDRLGLNAYNSVLMNKDSVRIACTKRPDESGTNAFCGIFTCVSVIKRLLGIHKRSIITPKQLMGYLNHGI